MYRVSKTETIPTDINIRSWVENAKKDPVLYRSRQVTEIVLYAIGLSPSLKKSLILKGGTLMAIAFRSSRVTGDVDFSANAEPQDFEGKLKQELNPALIAAAMKLRYLNLICKIQAIEKRPKPEGFENFTFPALRVHVASAIRNSVEEERLNRGNSSQIVKLEISFRDQVYAHQELHLSEAGVSIQTFKITELIAEKLRALLQQSIRHRNRRQDVYDIAFLIERFSLDEKDKLEIYEIFKQKCRTRNIEVSKNSLEDPELIHRAGQDWDTLKQEIGELPAFDDRLKIVQGFYNSLPWLNN